MEAYFVLFSPSFFLLCPLTRAHRVRDWSGGSWFSFSASTQVGVGNDWQSFIPCLTSNDIDKHGAAYQHPPPVSFLA